MKNTNRMLVAIGTFVGMCLVSRAYTQQVQVSKLLVAPVAPQLKAAGIQAEKTAYNNQANYSVGLYGEKIPEQISFIVVPQYKIDWDRETIKPVVYFGTVPLRDPQILTDKNDGVVILVSDIGNKGPRGKRLADAFTDDDVLRLRKELSAVFGQEKMVRENSYAGNIYVWKSGKTVARLTIENEKLDGSASEERRGVKQDGRCGTLTVYNNVRPAFYSNNEDYFNNADIRKQTPIRKP